MPVELWVKVICTIWRLITCDVIMHKFMRRFVWSIWPIVHMANSISLIVFITSWRSAKSSLSCDDLYVVVDNICATLFSIYARTLSAVLYITLRVVNVLRFSKSSPMTCATRWTRTKLSTVDRSEMSNWTLLLVGWFLLALSIQKLRKRWHISDMFHWNQYNNIRPTRQRTRLPVPPVSAR